MYIILKTERKKELEREKIYNKKNILKELSKINFLEDRKSLQKLTKLEGKNPLSDVPELALYHRINLKLVKCHLQMKHSQLNNLADKNITHFFPFKISRSIHSFKKAQSDLNKSFLTRIENEFILIHNFI